MVQIITLLCIILIWQCCATSAKEEYDYSVTGILIEDSQSAACTEVPMKNLDDFELCFFLRLRNNSANIKYNNTIIMLRDSKNTFELTYGNKGFFIVNYKGYSHAFPKVIQYSQWTKLCVIVLSMYKTVELEVNYRTTRKLRDYQIPLEKVIEANQTIDDYPHLQDNITSLWPLDSPKTILCIGASNNRKTSIVGAVAGMAVNQVNLFVLTPTVKEGLCLPPNYEGFNFAEPFILVDPEVKYGAVTTDTYDLRELCWGTHVVLLIEDASSYDEHFLRCNRNLNGRLLQLNEVTTYSKKLKNIFSERLRKGKDHPNLFNMHSWIGNVSSTGMAYNCPAYNLQEEKYYLIKCKFKLEFNFCLLPRYQEFYLYGSVRPREYDHYYTLDDKNNSMILKGEDGSIVEKVDNYWSMSSSYYKEYLLLHNKTLPIGSNKWKSFDWQNEYLLVFTNCGKDEFPCYNGQCVHRYYRHDRKIDCMDASDEEEYVKLTTHIKYEKTEAPPAKDKEKSLPIEYEAYIDSISAVSPIEGIAHVAAVFSFNWFDPRLLFNDLDYYGTTDCNEIWVPSFSIQDSINLTIPYEVQKTTCSFHFDYYRITNMLWTKREQYRDFFFNGTEVEIHQAVTVMFAIPCHFDEKRYPFGIESCKIKVSLKSTFGDIVRMKVSEFMDRRNLEYHGPLKLGDYEYLDANHSLSYNEKAFIITIRLQSLFSHHIVNSYIPSFLVTFTAHNTFYLPVNEFPERVMVSLTSQVVLAALMGGHSGARTSYTNYLDIWFFFLLTFVFFIIVAHMSLHGPSNISVNIPLSDETCVEQDVKINFKFANPEKMNKVFKIIFPLVFIAFFVLFVIGAADIVEI